MKFLNPITPSQRHLCLINKVKCWKEKSIKTLNFQKKKRKYHNHIGHYINTNRFNGNKKNYRKITFKPHINNIPNIVINIEYDPNRTGFISLVLSKNGIFCYLIAPQNMIENNIFYNNNIPEINLERLTFGYINKLRNMPIGTLLYNIELYPKNGGKLARAAGTFAVLLKKNMKKYCVIKLRSGEKRLISEECIGSLGIVSNIENRFIILGKAGRQRWYGKKSKVRGVAMNPVDHPHGGNTPGGKIWTTPWKRITKGQATRKIVNPWLYY